MTLKEYIEYLDRFVERHPEALDLPVIYSVDENGTEFHPVTICPTVQPPTEQNKNMKSVCIN